MPVSPLSSSDEMDVASGSDGEKSPTIPATWGEVLLGRNEKAPRFVSTLGESIGFGGDSDSDWEADVTALRRMSLGGTVTHDSKIPLEHALMDCIAAKVARAPAADASPRALHSRSSDPDAPRQRGQPPRAAVDGPP